MNKLLSVAIILLTIAGCAEVGFQEYPPGDERISIMGRTFSNEDGSVSFDWPGITIQINFTGSYCALKMDDTGKNFYNVFVDNRPAEIMEVHSDTLLVVASDLGRGNHSLRITKRTEGSQGLATFKGIALDSKGMLSDAPHPSERKMEFIGNSITCGFGTDSFDKNEKFTPETENNYVTYAAIMARAFEADYHIVAHSGQGVVRNYGYSEPVSPYAMPDRYLQVFDSRNEPLWNFNDWTPNLVVINLGTNDYSTQPHPSEEVFISGYSALISQVRKNYGSVPIFCLVGPMADEPGYSYVKGMVNNLRSEKGDSNIYFVGIPTYLMVEDEDLGASFHPNGSGQQKMADHVGPVIGSVLGWEY